MNQILFQVIIPFTLSALIVVMITVIAERYGTKVGGIIGTLPSTIVIAFIFISLNRGLIFASQSAVVVPAEMGINILFLFFFTMLVKRSLLIAACISLLLWFLMSFILYLTDLDNIYLSITVFGLLLFFSFVSLEKFLKVKSAGSVKVKYTPRKIVLRGILAGVVITVSVLLSNVGAVISGIFSVFPAIFLSTMLISAHEHGPEFVGGMAKAMIIGTLSTTSYAVAISFLYPMVDIIWGTIIAYSISVVFTFILILIRGKIG